MQEETIPANCKSGVDHRIWWLLLFAVIGVIIYFAKEPRVFPAASIDLKLTRSEITHIAEHWAPLLGYHKTKPIESTTFTFDNQAKTFLEYELGLSKANELMRSTIPIWYWRTRFCRPHEEEELQTYISPTGQLICFDHQIENDRALPSLSHEQAKQLAEHFVEDTSKLPLTEYKLIVDSRLSQPKRVDYNFVWEQVGHELHSGRLRISTTVSGNALSNFYYYFYVPEKWTRSFSTIRDANELLESIATVFYNLLNFSTVFVFIWALTSGNLRWRFALPAAAVVSIINVLETLNNFASYVDDYNTQTSFQNYLVQFYVNLGFHTLTIFLLATLLFGAAEAIYRSAFPEKIAFENIFKLKGLQTNTVLTSILVGYLSFAIDLGWVVSYYLIGEVFHFWCPLGIDNYQVLSSAFPVFSAIHLGVRASVSEELIYRVIGLGLAKKLFKNFWLANLFQAAAWAFMHSSYPQQPAYARGIELTLGGLLDGWILKTYGILPCLISHYLFDTFLDSKPLFAAAEPWLKFSALLGILPIALVGLITFLYVRSKKANVADNDLLNSAIGLHEKESESAYEEPEHFSYKPWSERVRISVLLLCLIGACFVFWPGPQELGSDAKVTINRKQAILLGNQAMISHHISTANMQVAATLGEENAGGDQFQYIFEKAGFRRALWLWRRLDFGFRWRVRFFKPLDPDEYMIVLDGQGRELSFDITKAEDAPGKRLEEEEATKIAEAYINRVHPEYVPYEFDNVSVEKRKARNDYAVVFKVPEYKVGDADCKIAVSVMGNAVAGFGHFWDIPDNWTWQRNKKTLKDEICGQLRVVLTGALIIASIWWAFGIMRAGAIRWRLVVYLATSVALIAVLQEMNTAPEFFVGYSTTVPEPSYIAQQLLQYLETGIAKLAEYALLASLALGAFRIMFPRFHLLTYFATAFRPASKQEIVTQFNVWFDAITAGIAYTGALGIVSQISELVLYKVSPAVPEDIFARVGSLARMTFPNLDILGDSTIDGIHNLLLIGLVAGLCAKYCRSFPRFVFFSLILSATWLSSDRYWQDYVVHLADYFSTALIAWFFVARLCKSNLLAYFFMGYYSVLSATVYSIVAHGMNIQAKEAVFTCLMMVLPIGYLFFLRANLNTRKEAFEP